MAVFVLVHGAWGGGWCWQRVARSLRQMGHEVYTPTLTGVGERSHLLRAGIDLDTHIEDILNVVRFEQLDRIILVGHSYGGTVITGVADAIPDKIASLIYLDAFIPENGQALLDLVPQNPTQPGRALRQDALAAPPIPAAAFSVNPKDAAFVDAMATPHPIACFSQKAKLTGAHKRIGKRFYIYASVPSPTSFTPFYERVKNDPAWNVSTVPCGHMVMLDMPDRLVELLAAAT